MVEERTARVAGFGLVDQIGHPRPRVEYWTATVAESSPLMYSNVSASAGSTQPLPVVVTTSSFFRRNRQRAGGR